MIVDIEEQLRNTALSVNLKRHHLGAHESGRIKATLTEIAASASSTNLRDKIIALVAGLRTLSAKTIQHHIRGLSMSVDDYN